MREKRACRGDGTSAGEKRDCEVDWQGWQDGDFGAVGQFLQIQKIENYMHGLPAPIIAILDSVLIR